MFLFDTASACGGPCPPQGPCDNCLVDIGDSDFYIHDSQSFWDKILEFLGPVGIYIGIGIVISFFITLGFYLVYKHKKDEHPWKHAFKKSWPRRIIIFVLLVSIYISLYYLS